MLVSGGCYVVTPLHWYGSYNQQPSYIPLSPTHYQQPPTPDHPPPSAEIAQSIIKHQILRHIQECSSTGPGDATEKVVLRRGGTTTTTAAAGGLHRAAGCSGSSGSLNSERSGTSNENAIEELTSDKPFAGLFRGSSVPMEWKGGDGEGEADPPSTATTGEEETAADKHRPTYSPPLVDKGTSGVGERLSNPMLSPLDEAEEWARIQDIMASFGGGIARESVFMAELEHEFQQRLGLSLSPSQTGLGILADVTRNSNANDSDSTTTATNNNTSAETTTTTASDSSSSTVAVASSTGNSDVPIMEEFTGMEDFLDSFGLKHMQSAFEDNGYDNIEYLNGILIEADLTELGITDPDQVKNIKSVISKLPASLPPSNTLYKVPPALADWLESIQLQQYEESFHKNGFGCMDRVRKMWEIELTMVLEVTKPGHKRRILASLGDRPIEPPLPNTLDPRDLSLELSKLNNDICELKEQLFADLPPAVSRERRPPESSTATIRRSGKKTRAPQPPSLKAIRAQPTVDLDGGSPPTDNAPPTNSNNDNDKNNSLPLRRPSQLAVMKEEQQQQQHITAWKHEPTKLIASSVEYVAEYLGSAHVKQLRGTESTMQSIQKLRKSVEAAERLLKQQRNSDGTDDAATAAAGATNSIVLSISYQGVKFMAHDTKEVICVHEIRNIHCACQDADDLSHFAYITKDLHTKGHYCHVFRVDTRDQATDIILTLGEAFEVAYQLALREQQHSSSTQQENENSGSKTTSHNRTRSECVRPSTAPASSSSKSRQHSHSRSHSIAPHHLTSNSATSDDHTQGAPLLMEGDEASASEQQLLHRTVEPPYGDTDSAHSDNNANPGNVTTVGAAAVVSGEVGDRAVAAAVATVAASASAAASSSAAASVVIRSSASSSAAVGAARCPPMLPPRMTPYNSKLSSNSEQT
uniref:Ankyrin repeat and SAM domain-containing protein 1A-like n=2 Tax=Hirondellea gigas TaxID=1518452 RepID=A0A6A7G1X9_9CRUS